MKVKLLTENEMEALAMADPEYAIRNHDDVDNTWDTTLTFDYAFFNDYETLQNVRDKSEYFFFKRVDSQ